MSQPTNQELRAQVDELMEQLEAAQSELKGLRAERDRLRIELGRFRESLNQANALLDALRESEARYRVLSGASLAGVYVLDSEGRIVYANPQALQMLGRTAEETIGLDVLEVVAPESRELVKENVQRRLQGGVTSIQYEARMMYRDGSPRDWLIFGHRTVYNGKPAIVGTGLDRTEAKRAERALHASEARFQAFMEHTPAIAFMKDAEGRFVYANRAFHEMLDLPEGGIVGKLPHDLFPSSQADLMVQSDREVFETRRPIQLSNDIPTRSGGIRHLLVLKFPLQDADGRQLIGGAAFDITDRKRAERSLAEQKSILQSILDSMGEGVAATNERGEFIIFNPAALRITGLGPMGTTPAEWIEAYGVYQSDGKTKMPPEELPLGRALRGESTDSLELFARNPAKPEGTWMAVTGRPLVDHEGQTRGAVVVFRDTTERRKTLEELTHAEARYRALVEELPAVAYISELHPPFTPQFVSSQVERLLGFTVAEWLAKPGMWLRQSHPADRDRMLAEFERAAAKGQRFVCEYRMIARDGSLKWVHDEAVAVGDSAGKPAMMQGVLLDVTDRETERGIRARLEALSKELVAVQEAERRKIGLELHDEIGQLLTGLKLKLGEGQDSRSADPASRIREADQLVDEVIGRVRELSQSLRPAVLDDLGLLPALVSFFGRYKRQTGIEVRFEHRGVERRRFGSEVETAAYRIVQEALTNVARHAHVRAAQVRVWAGDTKLGVQIEDEGPGFDSDAMFTNGNSQGLAGMRERAALLNGEMMVETAPGSGCRVTAELPIESGRP